MLNPSDVLDALVAKLKAIPSLVSAVTSADNIVAYHDPWPSENWTQAAFVQMTPPGILAFVEGVEPDAEWRHVLRLILRPAEGMEASELFALIVNGVPTNGTPTAAQAMSLVATGIVSYLATDTLTGGIEVGDKLYVHEATIPTVNNQRVAGVFYGYAMEAVGDGLGATIDIMHVQGEAAPLAEGRKLINETIHAGCHGMELPRFSRQTLVISQDASMDYFEVQVQFREIGDQ